MNHFVRAMAALAMLAAFVLVGTSSLLQGADDPAPATDVDGGPGGKGVAQGEEPADEAVAEPGVLSEEAGTELIKLTKRIPRKALLNERCLVELQVDALANVGRVQVSCDVPVNAEVAETDPPATTAEGRAVTWQLGSLDTGQSTLLKLWLIPKEEGPLGCCAQVSAAPRACASAVIGEPMLTVVKTGPRMALVGTDVTYTILVRNAGSSVAHDVVVTDQVPDGFTHHTGKSALTFTLGHMSAGATQQVEVAFTATKRGRFCNEVTVRSTDTEAATAQACTRVVEQGLEVVKTGTKQQFSGKVADYTIRITNTGDTTLSGVVVRDTIPRDTEIIAAPDARLELDMAIWVVPTLGPGKSTDLSLSLTSHYPGRLCNDVLVTSAEGLAASGEACTLWTGHPALLLEVVDTVDPLFPGHETTYWIRVTNQGTAVDRNIHIEAIFPPEVVPLRATGDTAATVKDRIMTTRPYRVLHPRQWVDWQVKAKGGKPGDARVRVLLTSDLLKKPVTEEESTHVR